MVILVLVLDLYIFISSYISGLFVCLYFFFYVIYVLFLNLQDDKIEV